MFSIMSDVAFFAFEQDFVASLRCIPMQVRYKLDTCGVKLKLQHWLEMDPQQRQQLVERLCATPEDTVAYREWLQDMLTQITGAPAKELSIDPQPAWKNTAQVPAELLEKAAAEGVNLSLEQWQRLTPLQRFALIKLSRPSHENKNFVPAMREFQLI
jgi:hypothetical protein